MDIYKILLSHLLRTTQNLDREITHKDRPIKSKGFFVSFVKDVSLREYEGRAKLR